MTTFDRLETFLQRVKSETYPEPPGEPHITITHRMVDFLAHRGDLPPGAKILDVGCGQGTALERFEQYGFVPLGITLNPEDAAVCRAKGLTVREMDQSFLDFPDASFDLVWCRHCLEHSIFPYFTLAGFERVLKPGGLLYVEVPAPDTACRHQNNRNHYSVLGKSMWLSLLERTGFHDIYSTDCSFNVNGMADLYWSFVGKKHGI